MKAPIRESGKPREEKKSARMRDGMPALNMRSERREIIRYASRPVAWREERPRNWETRWSMVGRAMFDILLRSRRGL